MRVLFLCLILMVSSPVFANEPDEVRALRRVLTRIPIDGDLGLFLDKKERLKSLQAVGAARAVNVKEVLSNAKKQSRALGIAASFLDPKTLSRFAGFATKEKALTPDATEEDKETYDDTRGRIHDELYRLRLEKVRYAPLMVDGTRYVKVDNWGGSPESQDFMKWAFETEVVKSRTLEVKNPATKLTEEVSPIWVVTRDAFDVGIVPEGYVDITPDPTSLTLVQRMAFGEYRYIAREGAALLDSEKERKVIGYYTLEEAEVLGAPRGGAGGPTDDRDDTPNRPLRIVVSDVELEDAGVKERLNAYFALHPDHTLVLDVGHEGSARVNRDGSLELKVGYIPENVKRIRICNANQNVKIIGYFFLAYCIHLTHVDLSPLVNVKTIGNSFLADCRSLKQVDLSSLVNVVEIGDDFLAYCIHLTHVDLSPLVNVKFIEDRFLSRCSRLKQVDLSGLRNVVKIGDFFLFSCSSLKQVDLSALRNVVKIGLSFLVWCSSLTHVDLSSLVNLTEIGHRFLAWCSSLTHVDLSPLVSLMHIGNISFLCGCTGLAGILDDIKEAGGPLLYIHRLTGRGGGSSGAGVPVAD